MVESVVKDQNNIFFLDLFDKLCKLINTWLCIRLLFNMITILCYQNISFSSATILIYPKYSILTPYNRKDY